MGANVTWHDAYCQLHEGTLKIKSIFNYKMPYPKIKKIDGSIYLKSRALHATNIWNDNIDYEINDSYHVIPITSIINIEQYAL